MFQLTQVIFFEMESDYRQLNTKMSQKPSDERPPKNIAAMRSLWRDTEKVLRHPRFFYKQHFYKQHEAQISLFWNTNIGK